MVNGCKILALIPARGGSKGIKNKNIINLCGKPLLAYTVEAATKSKYIDDVIVTTDSAGIAEVAVRYGANVPFFRPESLAQDTSTTLDAVLHAIEEMKKQQKSYDILVLLQPTSPLRDVRDIDLAIETFWNNNRQPLTAVSEVDEHPILMRTINEDGTMKNLINVGSTCRRQDMPPIFKVNGSIYINNIIELNPNTSFNDNIIPYVMKKEHAVDIDEMEDLHFAEMYMKNGEI